MSRQIDPRTAPGPQDADFEATDGGWDPYVASLLQPPPGLSARAGDDEIDGGAVMSFVGRPRPPRR